MRNSFVLLSVRSGAIALCVALSTAAGAVKAEDAPGAEAIVLLLNKAKILQLPASAVTIVVGNPAVADVTMLRRSRQMILTGKGFGETNLIALDAQGRSVGESVIRVTNSSRGLVVQRGMERETWDCSPRCQPTFSLGDANKFASENAAQIQARNASVGTGARPAGGGGSGY